MANNAGADDADNIADDVNLDDQNLADDAAEGDDDAGDAGDDNADDDAGSDDDNGDDAGDDAPPTRGKSHIDRVTAERNYYKDLADGKNPVKPDWLKDKPAKAAPQGKKSNIDEATLARLEVRGVLHPDDQSYVVKYAKSNDMNVVDALNDDIVKDRLAANKRNRDQSGSSVTPNNRTGAPSNKNVDAWVKKVQAGGELPRDPDMAAKVQDEIAKQSKSNRNVR